MVRILSTLLLAGTLLGAELPKILKTSDGWQLQVDQKPFLILGGQVNNSSAWPDKLPAIWKTFEALHANTVEVPVYWEVVEPQEGRFQFENVDALITSAREHHVKLVLLWFGSYKNGASTYVPTWVKQNRSRFPTIVDAAGRSTGIISPNFPATMDADRKAFVALMQHVKTFDEAQQTVIMVQIQNESGSFGAARDYSAQAERMFKGAMPTSLATALHRKPGTWQQVFGADAEESFAAHSIATYVNEIATAGKRIYALPMYVNCWISEGGNFQRAGEDYPSGGAVPAMLPIWKASAPAIDLIGPDIYQSSQTHYREAMAAYARPDNALFIPETNYTGAAGRHLFEALGEHRAIGFSPFGLDATGWTATHEAAIHELAESYRLLRPMTAEIASWQASGKLKSAVQDPDTTYRLLHFDMFDVLVEFHKGNWGEGRTDHEDGRVLIAQIAPSEFVLTGFSSRVRFRGKRGMPAPGQRKPGDGARFLSVEEGAYQDGKWTSHRLLNGDQTDWGLNLPTGGAVWNFLFSVMDDNSASIVCECVNGSFGSLR